MGLEIERKFLVTGEFRDQAYSHSRIRQGYILTGQGKTIRIRIRDDRGYLTIKGPSNRAGLARYEFETEVSLADAQDLMRICEPGIIDKTRYLVRSGNHIVEVDEFAGDNEGLVLAEIELGAEDEAFERPEWLREEVSTDARYFNCNLAKNPYKNW